jgi:hypothetical protein
MRDRASVSSVLKTSMHVFAVAVRVDMSGTRIGSFVEDMVTEVMRVRRVMSPCTVKRMFEERICSQLAMLLQPLSAGQPYGISIG